MKMPLRWRMPGLRCALVLMIAGGLLGACATKPVPVKKEAAVKEAGEAATPSESSSVPPLVVPAPDGKARVLVTQTTVLLQRQPGGPTQELDAVMDFEEERWAEKMKELAEGVRWSPRGTRVCILQLYKRGSGVAVFSLNSQPAGQVELDQTLSDLHAMATKRYADKYRSGRFYYITLSRWIDEDHLEINFSGNLVLKENDDPEFWQTYKGTARIELGAKSGTVQGTPQLGELTD